MHAMGPYIVVQIDKACSFLLASQARNYKRKAMCGAALIADGLRRDKWKTRVTADCCMPELATR